MWPQGAVVCIARLAQDPRPLGLLSPRWRDLHALASLPPSCPRAAVLRQMERLEASPLPSARRAALAALAELGPLGRSRALSRSAARALLRHWRSGARTSGERDETIGAMARLGAASAPARRLWR